MYNNEKERLAEIWLLINMQSYENSQFPNQMIAALGDFKYSTFLLKLCLLNTPDLLQL